MKSYCTIKGWALFILTLLTASASFAQTTSVKGVVRDSVTGQPLQFASIYFKGGRGVITNSDGSYLLETSNPKFDKVEISYTGYKTILRDITPGIVQELNIDLAVSADPLDVVITNKRRIKYRNKDNPAVELIRKVIDNKDKNRASNYDALQYEEYEKMTVSITKKPEALKSKLLKNYNFVFENTDTVAIEGKSLMPVYMEETLSDRYFTKDPAKKKIYVKAEKKVNFGEFLDSRGISTYLNRMYEDVDVYENNISLMSNQFLSPIASMSPTFYMFYIRDTVEMDGKKLVKLYFTPRNTNDLLFRGTIFITLDGNYAVQKLDMTVSKKINLNWVRDLKIAQHFEEGTDGRYHLSESNVLAEFAITKSSAGSLVGERAISYKNFVINQPAPDSVFKGDEKVYVENSLEKSDSFWLGARHQPLTNVQSKVYANIDSLKKMPSFRRLMDWATVLLAGYKSFGVYEMGPINAFYSFNPVEGFRLRLGGRTTPNFNKNIYFENYLAYGFKDQKMKYFLSGAYSFNHKSVYSYPLNYIRASYQFDTQIPGQDLQFVSEDNFLLSFKRGVNDKWLYNRTIRTEYVTEFGKGLRLTLAVQRLSQRPAAVDSNGFRYSGGVRYLVNQIPGVDTVQVPKVASGELSFELRWAPHEQFYQGKVYRIPIFNKYPIFRFRYTAGIKGLFGGQYNYNNFYLSAYKRFYLSQLGFSDVIIEGNYINGKVPFPFLNVHRANQTYSYQIYSYNLMNFQEFVSDHSASINIDHNFNGFIFNKIPLIKRLKLREVASFKLLVGGVRAENNPATSRDLFQFPFTYHPLDNQPSKYSEERNTFALGSEPYIEASVGIANIFKLIRVDAVKRFSYLNHPNVPTWGIRTKVKFDF